MGKAWGWAATAVAVGCCSAVAVAGWDGGAPAASVRWGDGRGTLIDATNDKVVIADPRAGQVVDGFSVPGVEAVTELDAAWLIETDRTGGQPRQLISVAKSTRQATAHRSIATTSRLLAGESVVWLVDRAGTAQRLDRRSLQSIGAPVRLFAATDIDSAVVRPDGALAVMERDHRRMLAVAPDGRPTSHLLPARATRTAASATTFWAVLPERASVAVIEDDGLRIVPVGFDLDETVTIATEATGDGLAIALTPSSAESPATRVALVEPDGVEWVRTVRSDGHLVLVDGEPALVGLSPPSTSYGRIRFLAPIGRRDTEVDFSSLEDDSGVGERDVWVDDGTLYLDRPGDRIAIAVTDHTARPIAKRPIEAPPDPRTPDPAKADVLAAESSRTASTTDQPTGTPTTTPPSGRGAGPSLDPGLGTGTGPSPDPVVGATPTSAPTGTPIVDPTAPPGTTPLPGPTTTTVDGSPPTRPRVVALAPGLDHTCALTSGGAVKCWGSNIRGQLGNGGTAGSLVPVDVIGLGSGVIAISASGSVLSYSTCAVMATGTVKCWGGNEFGELGDGTTIDRPMPVDVVGLSDVKAVATGANHACALTAGGAVKCWGNNSSGAVGIGAITPYPHVVPFPLEVTGLDPDITLLAAGYGATCALARSGTVQCWGARLDLPLGDETPTYPAPVRVAGLTGVVDVVPGGAHAGASTVAGDVRCWRNNYYGQIGGGAAGSTPVTHPTPVVGLTSGVDSLSSGDSTTCAVVKDGVVTCWGSYLIPTDGEFNTGVPADVPGARPATSVAVGSHHACTLEADGAVACWGYNFSGELGNGTTVESPVPIGVFGLS